MLCKEAILLFPFFFSSDKTKEAAERKEKNGEQRKPLNDISDIISSSSSHSRNIEIKIKTKTVTVAPNRTKKKGSVKNLTVIL